MPGPLPAPEPRGKEAALVRAMFDRVAPRYDLANTLLSFGRDAGWRRLTARAVEPAGARVLDVAAGTGALARDLLAHGARRVVAVDLSRNMLSVGAQRAAEAGTPDLLWVNADGAHLPFADASFDVVTIAFGLRNLADPPATLREFARVTRTGGRLGVLEFSHPRWPPFRRLYSGYLLRVLPRLARLLSPAPDAYAYLAESIRLWPDRDDLAAWIRGAGWEQVRYRDATGGIVAVHRAVRSA